MKKSSFRLAFLAVLAGSMTGCASPMKLFSKKQQQPFEEYVAQERAKQAQVAGSQSAPGGAAEVSEWLHQGHAAFQQGNLPEAQAKYFAVVQRQPTHPVANHRLAVIADRQQDYLTAQRHYFAALNASPNDPNLLNDIGYSFMLQSRYAEAESYLQGALQKNPKQSNAINNLGLLYAKQGQPDRALAMFRLTNSEAEAQAKIARLVPSGLNPAAQPGTMMANQAWPPQNPPSNLPPNAGQYNGAPNNWLVPNPPIALNGGAVPGPAGNNVPNQFVPHQAPPQNYASGGWSAQEPPPPNHSAPVTPAGAVDDPSMSETTRRLKEQMEQARIKAVSERQMRDNAERQRQEMVKRQLREEELGRSAIVNPLYSRSNNAGRANSLPNTAPRTSNEPIIIGSPPTNNVSPSNQWQAMPNTQRFPNGASTPDGNGIPNAQPNPLSEPMPNANGETNAEHRFAPQPNIAPQPNSGSPLDAMPTWPPTGSLPTITPSSPGSSANSPAWPPNGGQWPNGASSNFADDPARAAARMGMNAGPGTMFPITPGTNAGPTNAPNGAIVFEEFPNNRQFQGVSPTTSPNWPAQSPPSNEGAPFGEPPAGSFGPGNFNSSSNLPSPFGESPAQQALRDRLPPSEQYQTPGQFGQAPAGTTPVQPTSFGTNRYANNPGGALSRNPNAPAAQRTSNDNRWEYGQAPGTQSAQTSTPSMQGHLAAPHGDNSMLEYERMIQETNAETNRIRQQIDAQRQLPPSENFRRSRP